MGRCSLSQRREAYKSGWWLAEGGWSGRDKCVTVSFIRITDANNRIGSCGIFTFMDLGGVTSRDGRMRVHLHYHFVLGDFFLLVLRMYNVMYLQSWGQVMVD